MITNPRRVSRLYLGMYSLIGVLALACGGNSAPDEPEFSLPEGGPNVPIAEPEQLRSISQGIYGVTTYLGDVCSIDCGPPKAHSMRIIARESSSERVVAETNSSPSGFYELELPVGSYALCTSFGRCTDVTVEPSQPSRRDYELSVGPGWSN